MPSEWKGARREGERQRCLGSPPDLTSEILPVLARPPSRPPDWSMRFAPRAERGGKLLRAPSRAVRTKRRLDLKTECEKKSLPHLPHPIRRERRDQGAELLAAYRLNVIQVDGAVTSHSVGRSQWDFGWDSPNRRGDRCDRRFAQVLESRVARENEHRPALVGMSKPVPANLAPAQRDGQTCSFSQRPSSSRRTGCF
jgi:hypothetical protein